jgi:hypothetical protein
MKWTWNIRISRQSALKESAKVGRDDRVGKEVTNLLFLKY